MSNKLIMSFIPVVLLVFSFIVLVLFMKFYNSRKKGRRNPLTRNLLRGPGQSLVAEIEKLNDDIGWYLILIFFYPVLIYAMYVPQLIDVTGKYRMPFFVFIIFFIVFIGYCIFKLLPLMKKRYGYRLGLDCEQAVGQELNHLMREGYWVYHDVSFDKYNIDHVVVGPKGVFAVETKGRTKRNKKGGAKEAEVIFDGKSLQFPSWVETEPIEQAKRSSAQLSKWLLSAVGEHVDVQPVLALPGWFIKNVTTSDVITFSGISPGYILKDSKITLSETLIKRIVHQLEQRCRDIEPAAYPKKEKNK